MVALGRGPGQPLDGFPAAQAGLSTGSPSHLLSPSPWPSRHRCVPAQWSLSAIRGLRDTGASLHNGIEPLTRGFSIRAKHLAQGDIVIGHTLNGRGSMPVD